MVNYFVVKCPCEKESTHMHKISDPSIAKFVTSESVNQGPFSKTDASVTMEDSDMKNVNIFYYTCEESDHKCQVWIDVENAQQKMGKCKTCKS